MQGSWGRTSGKRGSQRSHKKRIPVIHKKRIRAFHTTWVVLQTLAAVARVETADKVTVAKEVVAEVPQPRLGRHQRLVPARV
jgi:hypothetical protein